MLYLFLFTFIAGIAISALLIRQEHKIAVFNANNSEALKKVAQLRLQEIEALSDIQHYEMLHQRKQLLWPATASNIQNFLSWIEESEALLSHFSEHEERLARLKKRASSETNGILHFPTECQ